MSEANGPTMKTQTSKMKILFPVLTGLALVVIALLHSGRGDMWELLRSRLLQEEARPRYSTGLRKNAEAGMARSQADLGWCYEHGSGVAKNKAKAFKWYRTAAEKGNVSAQSHLGSCYENGVGVAKDELEAIKWYRKAAEQEDPRGQFLLGTAYDRGLGVKADAEQAFQWYQRSAEQGYIAAQCFVANCYEEGFGVRKNLSIATMWYEKAAKEDPEETAEFLEILRRPPKKSHK